MTGHGIDNGHERESRLRALLHEAREQLLAARAQVAAQEDALAAEREQLRAVRAESERMREAPPAVLVSDDEATARQLAELEATHVRERRKRRLAQEEAETLRQTVEELQRTVADQARALEGLRGVSAP